MTTEFNVWDNISWLDILSFFIALVTFAVAVRLDLRQSRELKVIRSREEDIARRIARNGGRDGNG